MSTVSLRARAATALAEAVEEQEQRALRNRVKEYETKLGHLLRGLNIRLGIEAWVSKVVSSDGYNPMYIEDGIAFRVIPEVTPESPDILYASQICVACRKVLLTGHFPIANLADLGTWIERTAHAQCFECGADQPC